MADAPTTGSQILTIGSAKKAGSLEITFAETIKSLTHFLIDNPDFNLEAISAKVAGIAAKSENALTHKWMFDFDNDDPHLAYEFMEDIKIIDETTKPQSYKTRNGYAIVVEHGFDTRKLMEKWKEKVEVELKRDDLLLVDWKIKKGE